MENAIKDFKMWVSIFGVGRCEKPLNGYMIRNLLLTTCRLKRDRIRADEVIVYPLASPFIIAYIFTARIEV